MNQINSNIDMISADLEHLRGLVQKNLSEDRYSEFRNILNSLLDRQTYAEYHYREYRRIVDSKNDVYKQVGLVLSDREYWDRIGIKSHIIACMQHLHTVHDILAHLIAYALNLSFDNERHITLKNVYTRLQDNVDFPDLNSLLNNLIDNENFRYLAANVNHSKHKYNIEPSITVSPQEKTPIKCNFSKFTHHNIDYPEKSADEFIQNEFNRELKIIIQIENEIIHILEAVPAEDK